MSIYIMEAYQKIMKLYKYVGGGQFKYQLIYTFNSDMVKGGWFHIKGVTNCIFSVFFFTKETNVGMI